VDHELACQQASSQEMLRGAATMRAVLARSACAAARSARPAIHSTRAPLPAAVIAPASVAAGVRQITHTAAMLDKVALPRACARHMHAHEGYIYIYK
jgi:hypothetical protein